MRASFRISPFFGCRENRAGIIKEAVRLAKKKGYRKLSECGRIKPGDKVYAVHSSKTAVFFQIGTDLQGTASAAFRIIGAHVTSPRLMSETGSAL